ncbi:Hsp20/alpha crystallin family protein [Mesobacillus maritimus]|uniref:Hsp20/alpha crystallin family protein n=1 Tax=Mesobacillus maritimus TaxID=1643336 RepID=UPI00384E2739
MKPYKSFNSMEEARRLLGDGFWDIMSDLFPLVGPRVDMYRDEKELIVVIELPGITSAEAVNLSIQSYTLIVEGHIERQYVQNEEKLLINERFSGPFKRSISIPKDCAVDTIRADYYNGVLIVRVPFLTNQTIRQNEKVQIHFHS